MDTKVPILQVVLLFQMQLCPRNNSKPNQKWVKKVGNWSELHSEKKYYL